MAKRSKRTHKGRANPQGFIVVALTKDIDQAREYETLLKVNDIPVIINEVNDQSMGTKDIAVMVPEDRLDEAHVIIESQDSYDDFYDFDTEEEEAEEEDLESDFFEDEF